MAEVKPVDLLDRQEFRTKIRELMGLLERETFIEFLTWYSSHFSRHSDLSIGEIVDLYLEEKHAQTRQS